MLYAKHISIKKAKSLLKVNNYVTYKNKIFPMVHFLVGTFDFLFCLFSKQCLGAKCD